MKSLKLIMAKIRAKALKLINTAEITTLILIPITVGLFILIAGMKVAIDYYAGEPPEWIFLSLVAILCIFVALSGAVQIYRRETYGIFAIGKIGQIAVIIGWIEVAAAATVLVVILIGLFS